MLQLFISAGEINMLNHSSCVFLFLNPFPLNRDKFFFHIPLKKKKQVKDLKSIRRNSETTLEWIELAWPGEGGGSGASCSALFKY